MRFVKDQVTVNERNNPITPVVDVYEIPLAHLEIEGRAVSDLPPGAFLALPQLHRPLGQAKVDRKLVGLVTIPTIKDHTTFGGPLAWGEEHYLDRYLVVAPPLRTSDQRALRGVDRFYSVGGKVGTFWAEIDAPFTGHNFPSVTPWRKDSPRRQSVGKIVVKQISAHVDTRPGLYDGC
ncbi:MAG: hypothetical protein HYY30_10095 [Chloroflexi bacterium]|nr:hypothetical protein [Chloroflexota bacterium]